MIQDPSLRRRVRSAIMASAAIMSLAVGTWFGVSQSPSASHNLDEQFGVYPSEGTAPLTVTATYASYHFYPYTFEARPEFPDYAGETFERLVDIDFGDGTVVREVPSYNNGSVQLSSAVHTYAKPGTYSVKLWVTVKSELNRYTYPQAGGYASGDEPRFYYTDEATVAVSEPKAVEFSVTPPQGAAPLDVTAVYADYNIFPDTEIVVDFGDGTLERNAEVNDIGSVRYWTAKHQYRTAGSYSVVLKATTPSLSYAEQGTKTVVVGEPKSLDFSAEVINPSSPLAVTYLWKEGATYCNGSTILGCDGVVWDYGDGTVETSAPVRTHHFYNAAGTYTVKLTYKNLLTKTKVFKLTSGAVSEVVQEPPAPKKPALSSITVGTTPVAIGGEVAVKEGEPIRLAGTGEPGSVLTLTTFSSPVAADVAVAADGKWEYAVPVLSAGEHRVEMKVKSSTDTAAKIAQFRVAAAPVSTNADTKSSGGQSGSGTTGTSSGSKTTGTVSTNTNKVAEQQAQQQAKPVEEKKAETTSQLTKTLVQTGSSLPTMLVIGTLFSLLASFLIIRQPWAKHQAVRANI